MYLDSLESVHDEAVVTWLENAMKHARTNDQGKLLSCLECVGNELAEMRNETRFTAGS
jgi:hypothetical protein